MSDMRYVVAGTRNDRHAPPLMTDRPYPDWRAATPEDEWVDATERDVARFNAYYNTLDDLIDAGVHHATAQARAVAAMNAVTTD